MSILFSLLYVENYRSIREQVVSFDHRYECGFESDGLITIKQASEVSGAKAFGKYFYGKNIYSATCLVGKNGEGKTTLVDFLRDSFALLKDDIDSGYSNDGEQIYDAEKEMIELTGEKARYYHLDEDTCFLVIFRMNGEDVYLTNIGEERIKWEANAKCPAYRPEKKEKPDYQVAYFSMMRSLDGISAEEKAYSREKDEKVLLDEETVRRFESILNRYNIDFSEEAMSLKRQLMRKIGINEDLFMQIAFLKSRDDEAIKDILGGDYKTRIEAFEIGGRKLRKFAELAGDSAWNEELIRELWESPRAYFRPFSSGQYSRFAFLARLYWYMGGGENFWKSPNMRNTLDVFKRYYRSAGKEMTQWMNNAQINSDSVVLLIDEGELYYHPEWQRRFVKDVFDIIGGCDKKADVQVVFTTSSTFMLSDILREDVVVLSRPNAEQRHYLDEDIQTFGQNIHMLLANRFFMDSTIGERAENLITGLFEMLTDREGEPADRWRERVKGAIDERFKAYVGAHPKKFESDAGYDEFVHELIESIGEDIYRRQLLGMFEEYKRKTKEQSEAEEKEAAEKDGLAKVRELLEKVKADGNVKNADLEQALDLLGSVK